MGRGARIREKGAEDILIILEISHAPRAKHHALMGFRRRKRVREQGAEDTLIILGTTSPPHAPRSMLHPESFQGHALPGFTRI